MSSTIRRAALVVSAGILLSRILGFGRDVVMAALLGRTEEADLYAEAFLIPDYLFFLMAGGYLSITLVPILSRYHAAEDQAGAQAAFTAIFKAVGALLVVLTVGAVLTAPQITDLVFPEVPDPERLAGLTRIALFSQIFFGLGTLYMAAQYARQRFLIPTLAPLIYNLGIIGGGLIGAAAGDPSPEAFLWGGLAGAAVGNFALQWWGAGRAGMRLARGVPIRHGAIGEYAAMAIPLMIGQTAVALDEQWPRVFGQFVSEGATAGLSYARRLNMLPVGVLAQAAGVATYPFLAKLFAEGRDAELRYTVARTVKTGLLVALPVSAAVVALARPAVRAAFQYGSFGAADTEFVFPLLGVYALSIPFWVAHQIYTRGFYARRRMWLPVIVGTLVTAVTIPSAYLAARQAGAIGVAAVSSASIAIYTLAIALAWHGQYRGNPIEMRPVALAALFAVGAGAAAWLAAGLFPVETLPGALVAIAIGVFVVGSVYLFAADRADLTDVNDLRRKILTRFRR